MNSLSTYLPNEIIDIIARNVHELIMRDLNKEFKEDVEYNKAEKWGPDSDEPYRLAHDEFGFEDYFFLLSYYRQKNPGRHHKTETYYWWAKQGDTLDLRKMLPHITIESEFESESESEDELPPPPPRRTHRKKTL